MAEPVTEASARTKARLVGIFEILEALTATYGQVIILNKLVVSGNAAATAGNILGHEPLFRLGFVSCVLGVGFHIAWALLFYELFKSVNRSVSLFGLLVIVVGCAIQALAAVFYVAPLLVLTSGSSLSALTTEQLQALAFAFVKFNGAAFNAYLVFFGGWCVISGYLIFKSSFLPRVLGLLLALAGLAWMTYLVPPFGNKLFPIIAVISALAEIPLPWFFIFGFNAQRWKEHHAVQRV
jgi:hypothetical protein